MLFGQTGLQNIMSMMRSAILSFPKQFFFEPAVGNAGRLGSHGRFLVAGMGGSHLSADLLLCGDPSLPITVWSDYSLPYLDNDEKKRTLVIASSYSGNTEETLDAYATAQRIGMDVAVVAVGGQLLEQACQDGVPYVTLPDASIQPRMALGFSALALLKILGAEKVMASLFSLAKILHPADEEEAGRTLAAELAGKIPVFYSSQKNRAVAMNWKIKSNETGKIPAFCHVLPEMNHNEMTGFDATEKSRVLSSLFHLVLLRDPSDDTRVQRRMDVMEAMLGKRGLPFASVVLSGQDVWQKIFRSLMMADWFALATAESNGAEPEQVHMVEKFKRLMKA